MLSSSFGIMIIIGPRTRTSPGHRVQVQDLVLSNVQVKPGSPKKCQKLGLPVISRGNGKSGEQGKYFRGGMNFRKLMALVGTHEYVSEQIRIKRPLDYWALLGKV